MKNLTVQQFLNCLYGRNFPHTAEAQDALKTYLSSHPEFSTPLSAADFETAKAWAFANLRYDFDTSENQRIKSCVVGREAFHCQSGLVSDLLEMKNDLVSWENLAVGETYRCSLSDGNEWEGAQEQRDEKVKELEDLQETLEVELAPLLLLDESEERDALQTQFDNVENDIWELEHADCDSPDILEWWLCSSWMMRKLQQRGEAILETDSETWWGRQTSGQSISQDSVIAQICFGMEILEYQENDWSEK